MKLTEFRVREFRSVWDSGPIKIDDQTTCLVGKNEAGKTTLLEALYRTNPIIPADATYDETYDYPKREVEDYLFAVENGDRQQAVVVECLYELDEDDAEVVASKFGPKALKGRTFSHKTFYGEANNDFLLALDEEATRKHLADNPALIDELKIALTGAADWTAFAAALDSAEATEAVSALKRLVDSFQEKGFAYYVVNSLIWPRAPKYLYFDEYYQMEGQANLNALIAREDAKKLKASDHPLIGLINLARLNHRKLVATRNTTELKNKLEGAGNHLTNRIVKYWSQNRHIQMRFDVRDARPEDPVDMRQGINLAYPVNADTH
jgi:AAA ATPase domain